MSTAQLVPHTNPIKLWFLCGSILRFQIQSHLLDLTYGPRFTSLYANLLTFPSLLLNQQSVPPSPALRLELESSLQAANDLSSAVQDWPFHRMRHERGIMEASASHTSGSAVAEEDWESVEGGVAGLALSSDGQPVIGGGERKRDRLGSKLRAAVGNLTGSRSPGASPVVQPPSLFPSTSHALPAPPRASMSRDDKRRDRHSLQALPKSSSAWGLSSAAAKAADSSATKGIRDLDLTWLALKESEGRKKAGWLWCGGDSKKGGSWDRSWCEVKQSNLVEHRSTADSGEPAEHRTNLMFASAREMRKSDRRFGPCHCAVCFAPALIVFDTLFLGSLRGHNEPVDATLPSDERSRDEPLDCRPRQRHRGLDHRHSLDPRQCQRERQSFTGLARLDRRPRPQAVPLCFIVGPARERGVGRSRTRLSVAIWQRARDDDRRRGGLPWSPRLGQRDVAQGLPPRADEASLAPAQSIPKRVVLDARRTTRWRYARSSGTGERARLVERRRRRRPKAATSPVTVGASDVVDGLGDGRAPIQLYLSLAHADADPAGREWAPAPAARSALAPLVRVVRQRAVVGSGRWAVVSLAQPLDG